jgi:hypothetical protein
MRRHFRAHDAVRCQMHDSVARKWLRLEGRFCRRLLHEQFRLRPSEHAAHELRLFNRKRQGPGTREKPIHAAAKR